MKLKVSKFFWGLLFLYSCNINEIDKTIVLKISNLEITRYEFDHKKNRIFPDSLKISNEELSAWKADYIDRCILTAYAYEKGYDTIASVKEQIECISNIMMVQRYGYLWEYTISPIVDTAKIVTKEKIAKRSKIYYFDIIYCKNINDLLKVTKNDTIINNLDEFSLLKQNCSKYENMISFYKSYQWPFVYFWNYKAYLLGLKKGEVSKMLHLNDGIYFLYLDNIEDVPVTEIEKPRLSSELQYGTQKEIENRRAHEIDFHCKAKIDTSLIDTISYFINSKQLVPENLSELNLLTYYLKGTWKKISLGDFVEFYGQQILKSSNPDHDKILSYVNQYYYNDYLLYEADSMGLFQTDEFFLQQRNFKNNLVYSKLIENEFYNKINVDTSEIKAYYKSHQTDFSIPEFVTVDIYVFNSLDEAYICLNILNSNSTNDISDPLKSELFKRGLIEIRDNIQIDLVKDKNFNQEVRDILSNLSICKLYRKPVKIDDKYIIIYKVDENGLAFKDLPSVQNLIVIKIKDSIVKEKRKLLLEDIREQYPIEIDKTGIKI